MHDSQRVIHSLKFIWKKKKRWLTTTIFLSVTCYNVTMLTTNYYNDFFELGQQKINFSFFELSLPDDDPVYTLKKVMEELDFSGNFLLTVQRSRRMRTVILLYGVEASIIIWQDFWTLSTSFLKNIILFCRRMIMEQSTSWEMHRCLWSKEWTRSGKWSKRTENESL